MDFWKSPSHNGTGIALASAVLCKPNLEQITMSLTREMEGKKAESMSIGFCFKQLCHILLESLKDLGNHLELLSEKGRKKPSFTYFHALFHPRANQSLLDLVPQPNEWPKRFFFLYQESNLGPGAWQAVSCASLSDIPALAKRFWRNTD